MKLRVRFISLLHPPLDRLADQPRDCVTGTEMIREADADGDGQINYEEFVKVIPKDMPSDFTYSEIDNNCMVHR